MKILHTSDWHLGKNLDGNSRLEEQKLFFKQLNKICDNENIDLVLVCGDIYDNGNPPALAEELFYKEIKHIAKDGKRPVVIISGNHDNPERLSAVDVLAYEHGIIISSTPKSILKKGLYKNYEIKDAKEGYVELSIKGENIIILLMPYPSEKRLNEVFSQSIEDDSQLQRSYSHRLGDLFRSLEKNYRKDTINIAMGHFYVTGGIESSSERPIQLGGAMSVNTEDLPKTAQYIALGHLHRPQTVQNMEHKCFYSGSPIQYSKSEIKYKKQVNIIDLKPNSKAEVKFIELNNYKPIEIWEAKSIDDAINMCNEKKEENSWVYLSIHTDRVLEQDEIKLMKTTKADIIEITPIFENTLKDEIEDIDKDITIYDQFRNFYSEKRNIQPSEEIKTLFFELIEEIEKE